MDADKVAKQARLIDLVFKRVISEYIGIDGLERLFSDQYIDFEWEMHLGMDHSEYKMDFYRDHFIHQVRDAYMMEMLLGKDKLYKLTQDILSRPSASKVSQYFCTMVERQKQLEPSTPIGKYLRFDEDFIPRNIIKMAAYMAGLFHDIGYPETHLRSLQRRFARYMPSTAATNSLKASIDSRFSLLQNSLLFRVVPLQEIQDRVNRSKVDHGTLSALAFLLHFYENGIIFKLEPYKAAAIELAALAIFNQSNFCNHSVLLVLLHFLFCSPRVSPVGSVGAGSRLRLGRRWTSATGTHRRLPLADSALRRGEQNKSEVP